MITLKFKILLFGLLCLAKGMGTKAQVSSISFDFPYPDSQTEFDTLIDFVHNNESKNLKKTIISYKQLRVIASQERWLDRVDEISYYIANCEYYRGNVEEAEFAYLDIVTNSKDEDGGLSIYAKRSQYGLGNVLLARSETIEAIKQYRKSIAHFTKPEERYYAGIVEGNIAGVFSRMGENDSAITHLHKSFAYGTKDSQSWYNHALFSSVFGRMNEPDSSLYHRKMSIAFAKKTGNPRHLTDGYTNLASIYVDQGNLELAKIMLDSAWAMHSGQEIDYAQCTILQIKARMKAIHNQHDSAIFYAKKVYDFAHQNDIVSLKSENILILKKSYAATEQWDQAFLAGEIYTTIQDSLHTFEKGKKISQALAKDQLHQNQLARETSRLKLNAETKFRKLLQYGSIAGILIVLITFILLTRFSLALSKSRKRLKVFLKESKQKSLELKESEAEISIYSAQLFQRNKEIVQSLTYARAVQHAFLTTEAEFTSLYQNSFVIFKPKDIVSGDFIWCARVDDDYLFAVVDCTGHGAPGAMLSLVINNLLKDIVINHGNTNPGRVLDILNRDMLTKFEKENTDLHDGADIGICRYDKSNDIIEFSGANLSIYRFGDQGMETFHGTRKAIGSILPDIRFHNHEIKILNGDAFYMFSDGYPDQFGMHTGKKLKRNRLLQIIEEICKDSLQGQKEMLDDYFENWKGSNEQTDDVTLIGMRF